MGSSDVSPIDVMKRNKVIAVVGASKNPEKDAYTVPAYLKQQGYVIVPINPTADSILGEKAYPSLADLPPPIASSVEVVEVFRPSEELPKIALETAEMKKRSGRPFVFWAQLGLENEEAKKILAENGISYVMNSCMRVVHNTYIAHGRRGN
jgi:predicted CoA-binding protein